MSGIFQQVMHELKITQFKSSAYHPESQGALERFHQTLKNMIKSYCFDTEKNWDEGVHLLLFAVRESVQESLGFSPFELVFGHSVRGPLKLLKEKFLSEDSESLNLLQYVSDFRARLTKACETARSNLKSTQKCMKAQYDAKTVDRSFKPGDKVLALLPIPGNPLQARYFGPYVVEKKLSDLNYIIQTPGRRKRTQLCHVNMLKLYIDRETSPVQVVNVVSTDIDNKPCEKDQSTMSAEENSQSSPKLQNSDIIQNLDHYLEHLASKQREERLVTECAHLFQPSPTECRCSRLF